MTKKPHLTIKRATFNDKEILIEREMFNIIDEGKEPSKYFDVPVYHPITQRPMFRETTGKLIKRLARMTEVGAFKSYELFLIQRELNTW